MSFGAERGGGGPPAPAPPSARSRGARRDPYLRPVGRVPSGQLCRDGFLQLRSAAAHGGYTLVGRSPCFRNRSPRYPPFFLFLDLEGVCARGPRDVVIGVLGVRPSLHRFDFRNAITTTLNRNRGADRNILWKTPSRDHSVPRSTETGPPPAGAGVLQEYLTRLSSSMVVGIIFGVELVGSA